MRRSGEVDADHEAMSTLERAIDLLGALVGFDTVSKRSNMGLISFAADVLDDAGLRPKLVYNSNRTKAGLLAVIGPAEERGIVLSGHTDVVPVTGQRWSSDPFSLQRRGGRLFGRGTADMKAFLAVALASAAELASRPLRAPIVLAFSYDEEIGCLGAPSLIEAIQASTAPPLAAIVGEPSEMNVANRHRGLRGFVTSVTGRAGHSSAPHRGVNAIVLAAQSISRLAELADYAAGGEDEATTVNIGTIEGGAAINVIPDHCRFVWECRPNRNEDADRIMRALQAHADDLLAEIQIHVPEAEIRVEQTVSVPALRPDPRSPAERIALALAGEEGCRSAPFATEAGLFQAAGIPAVICGPGSPQQAHQPDEYVSVNQVEACVALLQHLGAWAARDR
jgi:acetylornithine deacetylase